MSKFQNEYSAFVTANSFYAHVDEGNAGEFGYLQAGISGEAGEQLEIYKKVVRTTGVYHFEDFIREMFEETNLEKLLKEVGDVLWYMVRLCTVLQISLEDLMWINACKLYMRHCAPKGIPWPFTELTREEAEAHCELTMQRIHEYQMGRISDE